MPTITLSVHMLLRFVYCLVFVFSVFVTSSYSQSIDLVPAKEYRERTGLPNFYAKVEKGKAVKIAYLGGSITEAKNGWREQSLKWFERQYPTATFTHVNAAIGGTGSDLGAYRLQQDVLVHKPDLVFVEFAVNDASKSQVSIHQSMEGIVRQIWQKDPFTDICFVYTLTGEMAPTIERGKFPMSASAMEKIADYYGIPSVHLGLEVVALAKADKLIFTGKSADYPDKLVFSGDNVHPFPNTGHRLYVEALSRALPEINKVKVSKAKHALPEPFTGKNLEKARMFSVKDLPRTNGWEELSIHFDTVAYQFQNRFNYLIKATKPGEKITIKFKGTRFGLYDVMGPGCGQYRITVDGKPSYLQPRFDQYCTYYRSNYFFLPEMEDKEHTVVLEVSGELLDKERILQKRNNSTKNNLAIYQASALYAAQVMIVGRLIYK